MTGVKETRHKMKSKKVFSDYVIIIAMIIIMVTVFVTTLYPFLNTLAVSLNNADDTVLGGLTIYPRVPTIANYRNVFTNPMIWRAYGITFARTFLGAASGLVVTGALAFGLSRKNLVGRKFYTFFCLIPMYFGGGLIPTFFLIRTLGLTDTFWVYIIPNLVNIWNMILMRSYFQSVPDAWRRRPVLTAPTTLPSSLRFTGRFPRPSSRPLRCISACSTGTTGLCPISTLRNRT